MIIVYTCDCTYQASIQRLKHFNKCSNTFLELLTKNFFNSFISNQNYLDSIS
jgi:hypothetical protein